MLSQVTACSSGRCTITSQADHDTVIGMTIGVVDEVADDLAQQVRVAVDEDGIRRTNLDRVSPHVADLPSHEVGEVERIGFHTESRFVRSRQAQQAADQLVHPVRLGGDVVGERAGPRPGRRSPDHLSCGTNRRQRGAKFMRSVGGELALTRRAALHSVQHSVHHSRFDEEGNFIPTTDFRRYLGGVAGSVLGVDPSDVTDTKGEPLLLAS